MLVIPKRLNETRGLRIHSRRVFVRQRSHFLWKKVRHFLKKRRSKPLYLLSIYFPSLNTARAGVAHLILSVRTVDSSYSRGTTANRASAAVLHLIGDLEEKVIFASRVSASQRYEWHTKLISFSISQPLPTVHLKTVRVILDTCTTRC